MGQNPDIQLAVAQLNAAEVVALPTETVYGLAARIDLPQAIEKIFKTKNRPFFDPLIVHVHSIEQAKSLVSYWPDSAQLLASQFWPGPLTLVLPKSETVNPMITASLDSVALRMPNHKLFLEILKATGPLAAPSANRFGRTSPTTAEHVRAEFADQIMVVDGGPSEIGIESTIVAINDSEIEILRSGAITKTQIEHVLKNVIVSETKTKMAPGQLKFHYMPETPLLLLAPGAVLDIPKVEAQLRSLPTVHEGVTLKVPAQIKKVLELELPQDPVMAARLLYSKLRELSKLGADLIIFRLLSEHEGETWSGIIDRLSKAAILKLNN